ncbi:SLAP domain-containing protein [Lactobacillus xylocopicola]|uniref:S-layer protein C-terminal domain-containing protein n=1 Tax=Lactobacillus xylocopicola TaxID=2976676 RepID=A0ABM8BH35_9LACO|nr:SLAP domain-containing protein [Lactobacillus xylocopicola]BDR60587.1 hypothetical protein KIM322_08480 [Lactobacillus xylocopicola]
MKQKMLLSFVGVTSLSLVMSAAAPVFAAETTSPATNQPTTSTTTPSKTTNGNSNDISKALALNNKYVKVTKASAVYDKSGKVAKKAKMKKGTVLYITGGINSVKNKTLVQFLNPNSSSKQTKAQYVEAKNVKVFKAVSYKVKKRADVYTSKGKLRTGYYVPKGKTLLVHKTKTVRGLKLVGFTSKDFIKWSALDHKSGKELNK